LLYHRHGFEESVVDNYTLVSVESPGQSTTAVTLRANTLSEIRDHSAVRAAAEELQKSGRHGAYDTITDVGLFREDGTRVPDDELLQLSGADTRLHARGRFLFRGLL
jgi:hypothetical protein